MGSCTCPASLHHQETRGNFPSKRGNGTGISHPQCGTSTPARSGGCWVDSPEETRPSAGHRSGQSPLLGRPSWELLVSVSPDGADRKQTKGCYGVTVPGEGCTVALEVWGTHHSLSCGSTMPGTWIWTTPLLQTHSSLCTGGVYSLHPQQLPCWEGAGPTDGACCPTLTPHPKAPHILHQCPELAPSLGICFLSPAQRGRPCPHHLPGT